MNFFLNHTLNFQWKYFIIQKIIRFSSKLHLCKKMSINNTLCKIWIYKYDRTDKISFEKTVTSLGWIGNFVGMG